MTDYNVTVGYRPTLGVTQQAAGLVGPAGPAGVGIGTTFSVNTSGIITASYFVGNGSLLTNIGYASTAGIATYATSAGITTSGDYAQSGATSAYATKRVLQYNETTKAVTYSNTLDAVRAYITGYGPEIHVSPVALDDAGNGTIGDPVKTIARAQVLAALAFETTGVGERKTIILHPGDYVENVTIDTQFTVLTTHELVGKNTTLSGTLTITKGCTIDGLKMNNLVISATSATGSVDIIGCTVTTSTTKTSSAYTVFRGCDLSSSTLSITGTGTVILVGGNYFTVTVNNAAAGVLSKAVVSMGPVTLTAGTLQLSDTLVYSATNTSNAITQSAGSVLTLNNSQTLIPTLTNVARNSFGGFYSILHSVYDKPNSTFGGTSLNSISYSQYINADRIGIGTTNPTSALTVVGDVLVSGIVTATSFSGNATSATYATSAGIATYATSSGIATYATNAGIATFATSSGIATYATSAGISTTSQGLTGTPNISVGIITATSYNGSGSNLTGIVTYITAGSGISVNQNSGNVTITAVGSSEGSWTVSAGSGTYSFTVPANANYVMWMRGNIPNGICIWNATVSISNTNVPVIGNQYGWYYTDGNQLVLTAIPSQIIGTSGSIITSSPAVSNTNTFSFGITNNSGTNQTVFYGYRTI